MTPVKSLLKPLVFRHPYKTIAAFLILVALAAFQLPSLRNDPNPWLLNEKHPARLSLDELRRQYTGSRDSVFILLEAPETIYRTATLERVKKLTRAFETMTLLDDEDLRSLEALSQRLQGEAGNELDFLIANGIDNAYWDELDMVREAAMNSGQWTTGDDKLLENVMTRIDPVIEVTSLSNTDNIIATRDGLDVNPAYENAPQTREGLASLKHKITGNRLFKNILFMDDPKYTSIIIELATEDSDSENQYRVFERVKTILKKDIPGPEKHYIAGMPVASATLGHTIQVDSIRLFPVVLGIVIVCLFIIFRKITGILTPVLVVVFSLLITLAMEAMLGVPVNVITAALPVFILSIGVADGIHFYSEFRDHIHHGLNKREALQMSFDELFSPIVMTSLTTAAAFLTLAVTEIVQLRHFGIFVALGTIIAMVFSLMFIPALLLVLPVRNTKEPGKKNLPAPERLAQSVLQSITRGATRQPKAVLAVFGIIILISTAGASRVHIDNDNVGYHLDTSPLVISTEKINEHAAGSSVLNILVSMGGNRDEPFQRPENLKKIVSLARFIENQPHVGKVMGLHALIERINYVMHNEDSRYDRVPEAVEKTAGQNDVSGYALTSQLLFVYENSGGDTLSDVVTGNYSEINIPVVLQLTSSRDIHVLMDAIEDYSSKHFPPGMDLRFTGSAATMVAATTEIVKGQLISLGLSFTLIFLLLLYTFRSLSMGLTAMMPLITTVLINFGIMGFFNIPLDIGTAVISSIVIGIGVDYSIHYLKRYTEFSARGDGFRIAVGKTVQHSGKAILSNALTVAAGFMALLFSILTPLITMGWMISVTMIVSALTTLTLLPAVLSILKGMERARQKEKTLKEDMVYASS